VGSWKSAWYKSLSRGPGGCAGAERSLLCPACGDALIPYSQDFLKACAEALRCEPADLIMRDPTAPEAIWSVWEAVPPAERPRAIEVLKVFAKTGS